MLCLLLASTLQLVAAPTSFGEAKKIARQQVYFDQPEQGELYCSCPFRWTGASGGRIEQSACGYQTRAQPNRAERIEWEHVVPVSLVARQWQCWETGGRNHCASHDRAFAQMEADLHNLLPVVGELNADRSNFQFAALPQIAKQHGHCDFKVDFKNRHAEPPDAIKGLVARIHFYMADHYQLRLSRAQQQLLTAWHQQFPVTDWERERDRRIALITGHHNPYVTGQPGTLSLPTPAAHSIARESTAEVIGNRNSKRYHYLHCPGAKTTASSNRVHYPTAMAAEQAGYVLAGNCHTRELQP